MLYITLSISDIRNITLKRLLDALKFMPQTLGEKRKQKKEKKKRNFSDRVGRGRNCDK